MRKPIRYAVLAGTAGAIALGGTTAALAGHGSDQNQPTTTSYHAAPGASPGAVPGASSAPGRVSADQARQIAQQRVPGGTVTEIQLDYEHGRAVWDVNLTKRHREYEVYVDATNGNIISSNYRGDLGDHYQGDLGDHYQGNLAGED